MKKLLAIVVLSLLGMGYAQAQQTLDVPGKLTETIIQELGLNEQQAASVAKISSFVQPAITKIESSDLSDAEKTTKIKAYADREKMNMKNILNDTQFVKYLELTGRI